jgi:tRNA-2-methylthio-N6-dimethylallyladenosine synthase
MKLIVEHRVRSEFLLHLSRRQAPAANRRTGCDVVSMNAWRLQAAIQQWRSSRRWSAAQNLLVEGPSKRDPHELAGRTENMRFVNFTGRHPRSGNSSTCASRRR